MDMFLRMNTEYQQSFEYETNGKTQEEDRGQDGSKRFGIMLHRRNNMRRK
jgi:hypothetical protein